jgi:peptidoglycan/xylan/chitin deacetylase (PgdA/CDA1 family)
VKWTVAAKTLFLACAGSRLLRRLATPRLFVFNYHRIRDPRRPIQFDEGVYGPDQSEFAKQVRWITTHFELLSEQQLIDVVESSRPLNRHCAMITFDDGYRDNYELAYPVLRKFNAAAIFFVPTLAVSERQLGWWDVIAWTIRHTRLRRFTLRGREFDIDRLPLSDVISQVIAMRQAPELDCADAFVDDLARAAGVDPPDRSTQDAELMTWDQLRELSRNQMAIGSHTHSHGVLSQLDIDVQRRELTLSKALLEAELGQPVLSLSYPVGLYEHFHRETKEIARQCGYRLAFSFLTGFESGRVADAYDIRRASGARTLTEMDIATSLPWRYYANRSALREPLHYTPS